MEKEAQTRVKCARDGRILVVTLNVQTALVGVLLGCHFPVPHTSSAVQLLSFEAKTPYKAVTQRTKKGRTFVYVHSWYQVGLNPGSSIALVPHGCSYFPKTEPSSVSSNLDPTFHEAGIGI